MVICQIKSRAGRGTLTIEYTYQGAGRASIPPFPSLSEGGDPVSTYEELQLIISVALLIIAILTYTHRK